MDEFLDLVINDYQECDAMIENLGSVQEYEKQIAAMKAKIIELEGNRSCSGRSAAANGNVDILDV